MINYLGQDENFIVNTHMLKYRLPPLKKDLFKNQSLVSMRIKTNIVDVQIKATARFM